MSVEKEPKTWDDVWVEALRLADAMVDRPIWRTIFLMYAAARILSGQGRAGFSHVAPQRAIASEKRNAERARRRFATEEAMQRRSFEKLYKGRPKYRTGCAAA